MNGISGEEWGLASTPFALPLAWAEERTLHLSTDRPARHRSLAANIAWTLRNKSIDAIQGVQFDCSPVSIIPGNWPVCAFLDYSVGDKTEHHIMLYLDVNGLAAGEVEKAFKDHVRHAYAATLKGGILLEMNGERTRIHADPRTKEYFRTLF